MADTAPSSNASRARQNREAEAVRLLAGEMAAEQLVEREGEALVFRSGGRRYMVEVRAFDITGS